MGSAALLDHGDGLPDLALRLKIAQKENVAGKVADFGREV
jgi:hypothetical protein